MIQCGLFLTMGVGLRGFSSSHSHCARLLDRLPLESLGYIFRADNPNLTQRYFRELPDHPRVPIHVMRAGSFGEQFALLFRDYVRVHPDVAAHYAELKMELAQRYQLAQEYQLYNEAKRPFMWRVIAQADGWA